ncbi:uncharacterized protein LOC127004941 isoform X2 [Eriocheir sinensis]|uniref:uncharacterized protein LOC127004941 isoform X1 n=1 Tax=Eriocheir sinensis TaxID=95602 RepID=UPI0021C9CB38|nr:uncharacterized protein LOC127004941 isoform X1 [Eriocheir sinensis]XP_050729198.1 uncharacterized protein LOC127004941 isoform X2 [Eriocheir sinensis]
MEDQGRRKERVERVAGRQSRLQGVEEGHRTIPKPSERKVLGQDRMESALVRCSSFQGFEKGHRTIPKPSERKVLGQDRMDSALVSCSSLQGFEKGHRTIPKPSERKVLGQDRMDSVMVSSSLQGVDGSNITFCRECKRVLGQGERVASCPCFPGAEESYRARLHERGSQESVERLVVDPFLHGVGESHGTVPRLCERRVLEAPPCCMAQEGEGWSRRARERSVGQTWTCTEGLHKGYGNETFIFPRHSHTATPIITTPPSPSPSTSTTNLLPCYPHHHLPMPPSTRPQQPQLKAQPMSSSVSCGSGMYRPFPQRPCSCHAYLHCDHD